MSEKNLDTKGRWRNRVVAFRVSNEENDAINDAVSLSGLTKQDYITRKLLNRDVIVARSPRTFKALSTKMSEIIEELRRIRFIDDLSDDLIEKIEYVTYIYTQTKED